MKVLYLYPKSDVLISQHVSLLTDGLKQSVEIRTVDSVSALKKAVQEAEEHVAQLEAAVKILEAQLSTPEGSTDMALYEKHGKLKAQLSEAEVEWEKAMEELEAALI